MQAISTDEAPAAIGPYSQAISKGELIFCSGQIALTADGKGPIGENAAQEAEQIMKNIAAVLKAAGSSLDRVVKTTIFLVDMADFASVNEVYGRHFSSQPPARSTVAVSALPKGVRVEIEAIACR